MDFIILIFLDAVKPMNSLKHISQQFIADEEGGAHVYIFGLLAIGAMIVIFIISLNMALEYANKNHTKPSIDIATHAAALDVDLVQAALGRIVWDTTKGTASFYTYLRKNLHLDNQNMPIQGSYLTLAPTVHFLGFVTNSNYPYTYTKIVTLYAGTAKQTVRTVHTTLYGPSIVAIVEVNQKMYGQAGDEPIVISSVASIRKRY